METLFQEPFFLCVTVFGTGLATVYILFKLTTSKAVKRKRSRRLFFVSMYVAFLAVTIWPVLCAMFLFVKHEYLLGTIPLLYALPYCLGVAIIMRPLIRFKHFADANGIDAAKARAEAFTERIRREAPTEEQYADAKGAVWRLAYKVLIKIHLIFIFPTLFLKIALGYRFGARVAWWPDFERASFVLFTSLSYLVAGAGHPAAALAISLCLFLLQLSDVVSRFETRKGVLKILSYSKYQIGLSDIVFAAVIMAGSFGCIHYCLSLLKPSAYSRPLTAIDGLYFSVITFATVGYGDIYPSSAVSKLACMAEIVSGCLVLLFGVNLAMMVWFQKFTDTRMDSDRAFPATNEITPPESKSL
jgi:hypothetical protein